jgi:hypothetical protein
MLTLPRIQCEGVFFHRFDPGGGLQNGVRFQFERLALSLPLMGLNGQHASVLAGTENGKGSTYYGYTKST